MTAQQRPPTGVSKVSVSRSVLQSGFFSRESTARILPFATYIAFIAIADVLSRLGWTDNELRWLYPVKIAAVVIVLLAYRKHYSELKRHTFRARTAVMSVIVGLIVLVLWVNLDAPWMQIGTAAGFDPTSGARQIDWLLVALRITGAALVVPVMEELFWRSFLMRWMVSGDFLKVHPISVRLQAIAVTAILFGFEHNLWLAGIVAGLAYTLLYMRTGTLWAPILAHAVTNGLLGLWIVGTGNWAYW